MKKYRLKKRYPSLPKDWEEGIELISSEGDYYMTWTLGDLRNIPASEVENNSEYWEEVIEKNWEIAEIRRTIPRPNFNVFTKKGEEFYVDEAIYSSIGITEEEMLNKGYCVNSGDFYISKVGRLSDDKVFSVGDKVSVPNSGNYKNPQTIISFEINKSNNLIVHTDSSPSNGFNLSKVEKVEPLFVTDDGKDIFEGGRFWRVDDDLSLYYYFRASKKHIEKGKRKYFATYSAAEEYLLYNKKCLSINDVTEYLEITEEFDGEVDPRFVEFVKQKNT